MTTKEFRAFMRRCKALGLGLDAVAERLGVHRSTVARWSAGGSIPQLADRACAALESGLEREVVAIKRTILARITAAYMQQPMPVIRQLARRAERETEVSILE